MKKTDFEKVLSWLDKNRYNVETGDMFGVSYGPLSVRVPYIKVYFENDDYSRSYGEGQTNGFSTRQKFCNYIGKKTGVVIKNNYSLYWDTYIIIDSGDFRAVETFKEWRDGKQAMFNEWFHTFTTRYGVGNVSA